MSNFILKYDAEERQDFISYLLEISARNSEYEIGYPRCDNLDELKSEIDMYENSLNKCVCIIYYEKTPVSIGGFLYTDGDDEAYVIGPLVKEEFFNEENTKKFLNLILKSKRNQFKKLRVVCSNENNILNKCYLDMGWQCINVQREMCLELDENEERKDIKYSIKSLTKTFLVNCDQVFELLNQAFKWNGNKENYKELLKDEYKVACVSTNNGNIIAVVVWSYLNEVDFSRLEYLAVDKLFQNKGIGESLINYVINDS
ncbi:TPA: GNAT family N-acetyltransferase, partial [Clostridium perfringens]